MVNNILVFAQAGNTASEILSAAHTYGKHTTLITQNESLAEADDIYSFATSVVGILPAVERLIDEIKPELVFCEASADGRLVGSRAATILGTSPITDPMELLIENDAIFSTRMVFGGSAVKKDRSPLPAVVIVGAGLFEVSSFSRAGNRHKIEESYPDGLSFLSKKECTGSTVSLASAKHVIGVGRGLSSADNLPLVDELTSLLNAEIGCTRPAAEEEHWYTKDRYIGVSGCMLKPDLYLALGISGQVQHMVGVDQAKAIFAIDKNENSSIFKRSDYGLVGDISEVLPVLIEKLK